MAVAGARAGRREAVRALKRTLILDAARRVFEAGGLEGASMRAIAQEAGYTTGALYFHFPSKEAVYGAVLEESLSRLASAVAEAVAALGPGSGGRERLAAAALAFYDFYAAHPRELDLGFYLFQGGIRPRGLSPALDAALNARLQEALAPIGEAARQLGAGAAEARAVTADTFAHAVGLLLLEHTRRIRVFGCPARGLMEAHVDALAGRVGLRPAGDAP